MAASSAGFDETARIIRAMDEEFVANMRAGKIEALVDAFYAGDAVVLASGSPAVSGRQAIIDFWKAGVAGVADVALNTTRIEVSGDMAFGVGEFRMMLTAGQEVAGKYVVVYRRTAGTWKAVVDSFSTND